jgi:hypothetical protein
VPIFEEGSNRGIAQGYFLPPIAFTEAEAVNIFLRIRKMQDLSPLSSPSIASIFTKMNTIVFPFLKKQIQNNLYLAPLILCRKMILIPQYYDSITAIFYDVEYRPFGETAHG